MAMLLFVTLLLRVLVWNNCWNYLLKNITMVPFEKCRTAPYRSRGPLWASWGPCTPTGSGRRARRSLPMQSNRVTDFGWADSSMVSNWGSEVSFYLMSSLGENFFPYKCGWGPFLTSPLGANFDPQGWICPQGRICPLGVKLSPGGEILCSPLH
jgi:hypothetical protein